MSDDEGDELLSAIDDSEVCNACGERAVGVDAARSNRVCESCGEVQEEATIRATDTSRNDPAKGMRLPQNASALSISHSGNAPQGFYARSVQVEKGLNESAARRNAHQWIGRIAGQFALRYDETEQCKSVLDTVVAGRWHVGRNRDIMAAACVYWVCRTRHRPLTMLDVADLVSCNVFALGRVYRRVHAKMIVGVRRDTMPALVDPTHFVEKLCYKLTLGDQQREIAMLSVRITNLAKTDWVSTGRKPLTVVGACVALALETCDLDPRLNDIAAILHVTKRIVVQRRKEILAAVVKLGAKLPWPITAATVVQNLRFIVDHHETLRDVHFGVTIKSEDNAQTPSLNPSTPPLTGGEGAGAETTATAVDNGGVPSTSPPKFTPTPAPASSVAPMSLDPPSFQRSTERRGVLRGKIAKVKAVLAESIEPMAKRPRLEDAQQQPAEQSSAAAHTAARAEAEAGFDADERAIAEALRRGVSDAALLEGHFDSAAPSQQPAGPDGGEELTEQDLPDEEMHRFIRSAGEVEVFTSLRASSGLDDAPEPPTGEQAQRRRRRKTPAVKESKYDANALAELEASYAAETMV